MIATLKTNYHRNLGILENGIWDFKRYPIQNLRPTTPMKQHIILVISINKNGAKLHEANSSNRTINEIE
jgi:hypothetical protein